MTKTNPPTAGCDDLANLLDLDPNRLTQLAGEAVNLYERFPLKTRRRRPRWIEAPKPFLKLVQRRLLDRLLYKTSPHSAAHGFYPELSIVTNARIHAGSTWVVSYDLKDFFPNTDLEKVRQVLRKCYSLEEEALECILRLTCRKGSLPQGAPTSPHLANLAFYDGDKLLSELANFHDLSYTRYADDMTFSGQELPDKLDDRVGQIVHRVSYRLAEEKTKRMGRHQCQKVTGLVVNDGVRLPRKQRRLLRAIRRDIELKGMENALARSGYGSVCQLQGHLAFERMTNKSNQVSRGFKNLRPKNPLSRPTAG
jgi:RNA-directed DNA polymerase